MEPSTGAWSADGRAVDDWDASEAEPVAPPTGLLVAAGIAALASILLWPPGRIVLHAAGYVLATFVTLGLLAAFKRQDLTARQSPFYSPRSELGTVVAGIAVIAVASAVAHIWVIATYMAG